MDYERITVADLVSAIERGEGKTIRLCRGDLADLFGVFYGTITANIKSLIKSGAVCLNFEGTLVQSGQTVIPEFYDFEMVVALAFMFATPAADKRATRKRGEAHRPSADPRRKAVEASCEGGKIRRWVVHRATAGTGKTQTPVAVFIPARDSRVPN